MRKGFWTRAAGFAIFGIAAQALALPPAEVGSGPDGGAAVGQAESRLIDRVVAVVEGQVITQSELEFETRVALVQHGAVQAASAPLDERTMKASLDYVIGQRLHAAEAEKLQAFVLDEGEVDQALSQFEEKIGGRTSLQEFLAANEADRQSLGVVVARSLRAERILDSKIRLRAQVSDADVRRYYDAHASELNGTWEDLRPVLKEKLVRDRYTELAQAEMQQLRRAASVRIIAAPGEGAGR
ncbi:MAG: hypothetical protein ACJ790_06370 [Myxococcaceae bacterium]